jgi:hypothetical protein
MDIGPVSAIKPVTMIKPSATAPDLSRVFEVEYLGESGDDEYTPANRKAGPESEDQEEEAGVETLTEAETQPPPSGSVSLFA